jgi:integrase/recombinase XerD
MKSLPGEAPGCLGQLPEPGDQRAIKFYFEAVLSRSIEPIIHRPRKEKKLPNVLSEDEVALLFKQIKNLKHKCVIYLAYSAALRQSEVLNLKPTDIDSKRNGIIIRDAKGKKISRSYRKRLCPS